MRTLAVLPEAFIHLFKSPLSVQLRAIKSGSTNDLKI